MSRIKTKFYEDNSVTNAKLAQMAAHTYKGNNTASTANATDVTSTQLTADLNLFTTTLQGLVPASGGGTTNFLRADGSFAVPPGTGLSTTLTSAHLFVGNGSNVATDVAVSGDLTLANTGAFTIASNVVSDSKFRQSAALSVVGRSANSTGNVADISAGADFNILRRSGTTIGFGSIDLSQSGAVGSSILANANTTATSAATASAIVSRDSNANTRVNNLIEGFTTTATAAGTTTLTVSSTYAQQFTGSTTQTVVLPDATTLVVGQSFMIMNRSTGVVTVNKNGGTLVQTMVAGSQTIVTVTDISSAAGSWDSAYSTTSSGGSALTTTVVTADTTMVAGNRYIVNKASTVAKMTLPATSSVGDEIAIVGVGSGGWSLYSNASAASQTLNLNGVTAGPTSSNATTLRTSSSVNDAIHLICVTANTVWNVVDYVGTAAPAFITSATGGTITTDGDFKVHTFTSSGTFQILTGSAPVRSLVIAGGGGGGSDSGGGGGGGGAGGLIHTTPGATYTVGSYTVTVGAGGAGGVSDGDSGNGSNSVFDTITATGGGGGGSGTGSRTGHNGGSGGGGDARAGGAFAGGSGTGGQGNNGGAGNASTFGPAGGGGGSGGVGADGAPGTLAGNGGVGTANSISGSSVTYASGGGGGIAAGTVGTASAGGGTNGSTGSASNATANTGGGGGGGSGNGGNGGSGIVILRYQFQG